MKIALVGPVYPFRGGIAHYTTRLHKALVEEGHTVLLVSFKRQYPAWLFPGSSDRDPSRAALRSPDAVYWLDPLNPLTWQQTAQRLRAFDADLLVLQWWTTFWALVWVVLARSVRRHTRVVFVCHNVLPHDAKAWERRVSRWVLAQAGGWVVHTEAERDRLAALLPGRHAACAPHPVYDIFSSGHAERSAASPLSPGHGHAQHSHAERSEASPPPLTTQADARAQLGVPTTGPLLLFFGMVRPYKGLDDLLDALGTVVAARPDVHLLVAGDFWGSYAETVAKLNALNLTASVTLHDRYIPNEDVATYFTAADVLVAPYRRATGSGVIQTARGMGKPVIGTDVVAPPADQAASWSGRFVPAGDAAALAAAILAFLAAPPVSPAPAPPQPDAAATWRDLIAALLSAAGLSAVQGDRP